MGKAKDFLQRAFSIILLATIVIWFFQYFDFRFNIAVETKDSILAIISGWLVPIFKPLGLGDWRICTSLITGVLAKESVVSTMKVLFVSGLSNALTTSSALAILVFITLYTPCIAAISLVNRELGKRWALFMVIWQFVLAWMLAVLSVLLFNGFVG